MPLNFYIFQTMIKRKNYLGVLLAVLLVSCQCEKDEILEQSVMKTSLVSIQENDLNKSRLQLAFMLSQALSGDYKMQNRLIDECSKAFDGDMNVLCAALFEPQKQKESGSFYSLLQQKVNNNVINNINTVDKDGNIITEYTEGKGARTFRDPIRGTFCKKKGDKVFRVVVNNQLPMWIETSMLGDKFLYYVLEKDSGKSAVWNTPSIPVKTEGIKGKAASDWISAGVKIIKLIGKLLYRENHDDYITELYDYVAKDNVIRDNSLINDSNFNRSFGGLQWWITSQQD